MKFDNNLTESEHKSLLAYVKKQMNNVDFEVLKLTVNGKTIQMTVYVEGDGEIYISINRRKDGFRILSIG